MNIIDVAQKLGVEEWRLYRLSGSGTAIAIRFDCTEEAQAFKALCREMGVVAVGSDKTIGSMCIDERMDSYPFM